MSQRPPRRLLAVLACLAVALLPQPASSTSPTSARDRGIAIGESGSGPPAWSIRVPSADADVRWTDVSRSHWARSAIDHVGATNDWMRDFRATEDGSYPFRPDAPERRSRFARALFRAFGEGAQVDPSIAFDDLSADDRYFHAANVAVARGWLGVDGQSFRPRDAVTTREVHRALVLALGLGDLAAGADAIHLRDGTPVATPEGFGTLLIGMRLGLRYNHGDESLDVGPDDALPRAEVAWSLYRATTAPSWVRDALAAYADVRLPNLSEKIRRVLAWGVSHVGAPYVWGGDWATATPDGYCCGWQPRGGFDCSGLMWWVVKKAASGWDNTPPREYAGWDLPQRASSQMASAGGRLPWQDIRPGDLLFYDGNGDGTVDHVDLYLGNGWALDSGSSNAGTTILRVSGSWYEDHFVHARRVMA